MPKQQNETISSRESQLCHLTQAGQTAWIWQFSQAVLGGNFLFPPSSGSGLMIFWCHFCSSKRITKPKCWNFYFTLCILPFKPTVYKVETQSYSKWNNILGFFLHKHSKFWSISIGQQVEHKPLLSEERYV